MANAPSSPDLDGLHQRSLHSISRFKCGCASLLASRASHGIQKGAKRGCIVRAPCLYRPFVLNFKVGGMGQLSTG